MKKTVKYVPIFGVVVVVLAIGTIALKKYFDDNLPVFSGEDWL